MARLKLAVVILAAVVPVWGSTNRRLTGTRSLPKGGEQNEGKILLLKEDHALNYFCHHENKLDRMAVGTSPFAENSARTKPIRQV